MAYNSTGIYSAGLCESILTSLDEYAKINNPATLRTPIGFLEGITSPLNKVGGVELVPIQQGSKKRTVRVKWMTRATEDMVSDVATNGCETELYDDFQEEDIEVTLFSEISWGLDQSAITAICESNSEMVAKTMALKFDAISKNINKKLLAKLAANFGENKRTGLTTATDVEMLTATSAASQEGIQDLISDYQEYNQFMGTPILVGSGNVAKALSTIATGCCNQEGVDILQLSNTLGFSYFKDYTIQSVLGANQFAILAPDTTHFVEWNKYVGDNDKTVGSTSMTTIRDPRNGILYDMKVHYDECEEQWVLTLSKQYDLFQTPVAAFDPADELYGVNGSLRYTATKAS